MTRIEMIKTVLSSDGVCIGIICDAVAGIQDFDCPFKHCLGRAKEDGHDNVMEWKVQEAKRILATEYHVEATQKPVTSRYKRRMAKRTLKQLAPRRTALRCSTLF